MSESESPLAAELLVDDIEQRFMVSRVRGREALSRPYRFDVTFLSSRKVPVEGKNLLGRPATLRMCGGAPAGRTIRGLIAEQRMVGHAVRGDRFQYVVRIVPRLAFLAQRRNSRVFQNRTVMEILGVVLGRTRVRVRSSHLLPLRRMEYCVQYRETDLEFVSRLLAEHGIFYYFEHPGDDGDDAASLLSSAGGALRAAAGELAGEGLSAAAGALAGAGLNPGAELFGAGLPGAASLPGAELFGAGLSGAASLPGAELLSEVAAGDAGLAGVMDALTNRLTLAGEAGITLPGLDGVVGSARRVTSEVIVLCDQSQHFPALPDVAGGGVRRARFAAQQASDTHSDAEVVEFEWRARTAPTATHVQGFDYRNPLLHVSASTRTDSAARPDEASIVERMGLELQEHVSEHLHASVDRRTATLELQRARRRALEGEGSGHLRSLAPGYRWVLEDHPSNEVNREFVATAVTHALDVPELAGGDAPRRPVYRNRFRCIPAESTFRPKKPARSLRQISETATVVAPEGEAMLTDPLGRIRVRFHWDRSASSAETSSCWIRVVQPWAGGSWGSQFVPRAGMEVLVTFLDGDADHPVVVGALYNGTHQVPFPLPAEESRSGIRTQSIGADGYNELSFEDRAGSEQIRLRAQRDHEVSVGHDQSVSVRHDRALHVGNDERAHVEGSRSTEVDRDASEVVRGNRAVRVEGSREDVTRGAEQRWVVGDASARIDGHERREVGAAAQGVYRDDRTDTVRGSYTVIVGRHDARRAYFVRAEGTAGISSSGPMEFASEREIVLRCGDSVVRIGPDRIEMDSPNVSVRGGGAGASFGDGKATLRARQQAQVLADQVLLKASSASVGLGADADITGANVRLRPPGSGPGAVRDESPPPTVIELVDADGHPIGHQRFRLVLEDGSERVGVLDADGRAELDTDVAGTVLFPDLGPAEGA